MDVYSLSFANIKPKPNKQTIFIIWSLADRSGLTFSSHYMSDILIALFVQADSVTLEPPIYVAHAAL